MCHLLFSAAFVPERRRLAAEVERRKAAVVVELRIVAGAVALHRVAELVELRKLAEAFHRRKPADEPVIRNFVVPVVHRMKARPVAAAPFDQLHRILPVGRQVAALDSLVVADIQVAALADFGS